MAHRLKYGLKDAWWFWQHLPDSMRLILNLLAFVTLGVTAALSAADYPMSSFSSLWFSFGIYWFALWTVWQPLKILTVLVSINRRPARVQQLKQFLIEESRPSVPPSERKE